MTKAEKIQKNFERLEIIYGFWLLDTLFELMFAGKLTIEETKNLIKTL